MPRKTRTKSFLKSQKPPLQFVEPPLDGARYHHVPEVRGALNPKSFLFDEQQESSTASSSWVTPQFEQLPLPVPRGRRRRKTCISASNNLDRSSQLLRKSSVCKFPSLSFERSSAQPLRQKRTNVKSALESAVRAQQSLQVHEIGSLSNQPDTKTQKLRTSLRESTADRRLLSEVTPDCEASTSGRNVKDLKTPGNVARPSACQAICTAITPVSATYNTPGKDNVFSPPDVETPELHHNGSTSFLRFLLPPSQPTSPPHCLILAADTPERDYGVKVTWRRRKGLMRLLRDRGNLSKAEALFNIQ